MQTQEKPAGNQNVNQKQATPVISLPKGGGAIRGIGEKFAANPVTGTGSMSVPIFTSPGRFDFGPELSLSYDSGAGNGPFGFGWHLSLPSITRKTDKGLPEYRNAEESDVFLLSGAEDLAPVLLGNGARFEDDQSAPGYVIHRYRPRIEGLFARIERWTSTNDPADVHWRSISRDNILSIYGRDDHSRIADPADGRRIFSWLICETRDDKGNGLLYEYKKEDSVGVKTHHAHERNRTDEIRSSNRYIKRILYGNRTPLLDDQGRRPRFLTDEQIDNGEWLFEVVFDYGEHHAAMPTPNDAGQWPCRQDPFSTYRAGFELRTYRICERVLMFHHFETEEGVGRDCLVRSTDLTYSHEQNALDARNPIYTFLLSVTKTGYKRENGSYLKRSLPPVEFEYTLPEVQDRIETVDADSIENLPNGLDGTTYQWTDLHGEGIPGILTEQGGGWFYKRNISPISEDPVAFEPLERVAVKPNLPINGGQARFMDLAGDGQTDLVVMNGPMPGLYEHDTEESWHTFRPFTARLNRDLEDPNLKFIDLDGDGHADVLISENDAFVWHASLAETGFGPAKRVSKAMDEEKGPRLVFADATQSIYLADLSGDGLTDLARVRNGEICYWPNLGYGRFGAKVAMDDPPWFDNPDQFDQERIRLADIDGTGTTDIIYLHRNGVRLYFNQSGNGWSKPRMLNVFPPVDDLVSIIPLDLRGNATACLVWSSPWPGDSGRQMRYVDLMGGVKPHLLKKTRNNLGGETHIRYASSTQFYLADKKAGRPWITKLPFPVHVVERVEAYDYISRNHFVTTYSYHHGYFDGAEREFRGFGMVEQKDTEVFAVLRESEEFPAGDNIDGASHMPPVLTKTWFHTGVYLDRAHVSRQFEGEYFREPGLNDLDFREMLLRDTILPDGLTTGEEREACRALKGAMLRQEVYGLDGTDKEHLPYTVTEQNLALRCLQPRNGNRHAVFFTHDREAISYHYERNPDDPRVSHSMTLAVDDWGNVEKSVTIGYGRKPGQSPLQGDDREKQEQKLITYTETDFTNSIGLDRNDPAYDPDNYRTPLPSETRTYELTGLNAEGNASRFSFEELYRNDCESIRTLTSIPYEKDVDYAAPEKRLIERVCTVYRKNDLTGLLEKGKLEFLALPGETYQLAFTPGLLEKVYKRPLDRILPPGAPPPEDLLANHAEVLGGRGPDQGGYVDLEGNNHWWIPSGRVYCHVEADPEAPQVSAAQELEEARKHFFLPRKYSDPFGHSSTVEYDHDLLVAKTADALGNTVKAAHNYRVLQPKRMIDPNNNHTIVAFDALGLVVGTAIQGKITNGQPESGDNLDDFLADVPQAGRDTFFEHDDPHISAPDLLKGATTRIIYDLDRFKRSQKDNPDDPENWQPVYAATLARETHVSDPLPPQGLKIQISFSYSDGFGREIQKKIQAEPGPLTHNGPIVSPRWVGSGWTIFNNKGKPVLQYEPFFSKRGRPDNSFFSDHRFEFGIKEGVSPFLFYDPLGRVMATLHPNHTYEKVVFDPWQQFAYDVNDTVAVRNDQTGDPRTDPDIFGYVKNYFKEQPADWETWYDQRIHGQMGPAEQDAAQKAAVHADTPTTTHFDALGRPFITAAVNRYERRTNGEIAIVEEDPYHTRIELDIEGNQRTVRDAIIQNNDSRGRLIMKYDYYMAGPEESEAEDEEEESAPNRIHQASMEAGERWILNDVAGNPIRAWDSRGHTFTTEYDKLRRPERRFVQGAPDSEADPRTIGGDRICIEWIEYGEGVGDETLNLRTQIWRHSDAAGVTTNRAHDPNGNREKAYDFKGNLLCSTVRLVSNYRDLPNWDQQPALENETFTSSTRYDALNRPIQSIAPHSDTGETRINVTQPVYNEANLLERIDVWLGQNAVPQGLLTTLPSEAGVNNIDYDPKGQRIRIEYQNGAVTTYTYDPETFRLVQLKTVRGDKTASDCAPALNPRTCGDPPTRCSRLITNKCVLQDLNYTYDPAGNITYIRDDAQQIIFFKNRIVEPSTDYRYDALYRLIEATGREHLGQSGKPAPHSYNDAPRVHLPHPADGNAMGSYREMYAYDAVGNFLTMQHRRTDGQYNDGWTRSYFYAEESLLETSKTGNRLSRTSVGNGNPTTEHYTHDLHGNMTSMPHLPAIEWDYQDRMQGVDLVGGGKAFYVYDAGGERVRKAWEKSPNLYEERIYLGGFEVFRRRNGNHTVTFERETLHVMDDQQCIVMVETRTKDLRGDDDGLYQLTRYQLGNHLGSSSLELDRKNALISYEEYHPYGTPSFQACRSQRETPKRYRYTGKERDEETGLNYHGARYYASWIKLWLSTDPLGITFSGVNLYRCLYNNPIRFVDRSGAQPEVTANLRKNPPPELTNLEQHKAEAPPEVLTNPYSLEVKLLLSKGAAKAKAYTAENSYRKAIIEGIKLKISRDFPSLKKYLAFIEDDFPEFSKSRYLAVTSGWAKPVGSGKLHTWMADKSFASVQSLRRIIFHEIRHLKQRTQPNLYHHSWLQFDTWIDSIGMTSDETENSFAAMREFEARLIDLENRKSLELSKRDKANYLLEANILFKEMLVSHTKKYMHRWQRVRRDVFQEVHNYIPLTQPGLQTVLSGSARTGDIPLSRRSRTFLTRVSVNDVLTYDQRALNILKSALKNLIIQ